MQLFARLVRLAGSIGGILVVLAWFFVMQSDWDTAALLIKPGAYLFGGTAIATFGIYAYAALRK